MRYAIRRVNPISALLYGLLLGLVGSLIPSFLLGWLVRAALLQLQGWLARLNFVIPLPLGEGLTVDLVQLLQLSDTQARLTALGTRGGALMLAIALGTAAAVMLLTGLTAAVGALLYNLFARALGGVEVTLDPLDAPVVTPSPAPVRPAATNNRPTVNAHPPAPAAPPPKPAPATPPKPVPATPLKAAAGAWLMPAGGGERLTLGDPVTRIGSAPDNDIVLPGLSPQHAEIRRESGRYLIYDLGSRRTWVNDDQVAAVHMLKDGFRLQLGQVEYLVSIPAA
ncbi:DUF3566 domain-containing protein [Promineifilum sp.]|uniref:DUF3566 domain-containing protein n=1 Tax=Promineifilum sp. TaxID=2664178 RepID=UPI0035AED14C